MEFRGCLQMDEQINNKEVEDTCEHILNLAICDFVGFAIQSDDGLEIKWNIATGSSGGIYKRLSAYYGKGVAGKVISDRKSTRLNSSHVAISYAVFCLKN